MKLTEDLNFFKNLKKFDEKCHYECCRYMQLLIINEPNQILFNQGRYFCDFLIVDFFFIIKNISFYIYNFLN